MLNLSHKKLEVYTISMSMVKEVYRITALFPAAELYGIVSQLRRASVSVISNLAEGAARKSGKEKRRFYEISRSSVVEIDTQLEISLMLSFLSKEDIMKLKEYNESIFRILSTMIRNLGHEFQAETDTLKSKLSINH